MPVYQHPLRSFLSPTTCSSCSVLLLPIATRRHLVISDFPRRLSTFQASFVYPKAQQPSFTMTSYHAQSPVLTLNSLPEETALDSATAFNSIKTFLEPGSTASAEATASSILAMLPASPPPADGSDELWSLYNVLIGIAKQIPHDHPALVKLVRVVDRLGRSPKTTFTRQDVCHS